MKRTVLTKEIDNYVVVLGFDQAVVDPIATNEKMLELLKQTDEYEAHKEKVLLIAEKTKAHISLIGKRALTEEARLKKEEELEALKEEIISLQEALQEHLSILDEKTKEIRTNNLIYFEPKLGEGILEDETLIEKHGKLKKEEALTVEGEVIPNHKGKVYYKKENGEWIRTKVKKIGEEVPSNSKLDSELTDEERGEVSEDLDKQRIKRLNPAQKENEKQEKLRELLVEAASKKVQYEILGDEDPLGKSQAWYNEKKAELEAKYV
jgi:hypothetical protein